MYFFLDKSIKIFFSITGRGIQLDYHDIERINIKLITVILNSINIKLISITYY